MYAVNSGHRGYYVRHRHVQSQNDNIYRGKSSAVLQWRCVTGILNHSPAALCMQIVNQQTDVNFHTSVVVNIDDKLRHNHKVAVDIH